MGEKFDALSAKIDKEPGYSKANADAAAAAIGRKAEGKSVFDAKAAEGRKKAAARVAKHRGKK